MKRSVIASKAICNTIATVIYDIQYGIDDKVLVGEVIVDNGHNTPHWTKLRTNSKGRTYFMHYGKREYLDQYILADMW